ncbi:unnamed protein product [Calypogeia fissa]
MQIPSGMALTFSCSAVVPPSHSPRQGKALRTSQTGFKYDRASPAVRWPQWYQQQQLEKQQNLSELADPPLKEDNGGEDPYLRLARLTSLAKKKKEAADEEEYEEAKETEENEEEEGIVENLQSIPNAEGLNSVGLESAANTLHTLPKRSDLLEGLGKKKRAKMSRMALLKATDWRERVKRLQDAVCQLPVTDSVADLLNKWPEQLAPTDYCFLVKQVGYTHWARALELFEWLNMRHWYTPNNRMLSAILGVLGRANQVDLAEEIFQRVEPELGDCVQVFNAMLSVHAKHGNWERMQTLLKIMLEKGCERDLVTYNTLISGRAKAGLQPGVAMDLLREIWQAGLRPDTVSYNTLISVCSQSKCYEDAVKIYVEMNEQRCQADIWTYNSMISVYGRCGLDEAAEEVYQGLRQKGLSPDAITYNSILFAYANKGRVEDVDHIRKEMEIAGCREDVITYNTIIDMYGKANLHDKALAVYEQMKATTRKPDTVTYVVLIDGLGKAGKIGEAESVFKEMVQARLKPSLNTFCAMICAYAKVAMYEQAAEMYQDMLEARIRPDQLAYSVMLDVFLNLGQAKNVLSIYASMMPKYKPGLVQSGLMLQLLKKEGMTVELEKLGEQVLGFGLDPVELCSSLAKVGLCDSAAKAFLAALSEGRNIDFYSIDLLLNSYAKANRLNDARSLLNSISFAGSEDIHEQLIAVLANNEKFEEAREELENMKALRKSLRVKVFRSLIVAYELAGMAQEAVQMFREMQNLGLTPDVVCCRSAVLACCRSGNPDEGRLVLQEIQTQLGGVKDAMLHLTLIKAYIKMQKWDKSALAFTDLKEAGVLLSAKDYDSLMLAYAQAGQAEQVQNLLKHMANDGLNPSSSSSNALLGTLLDKGRLVEVDEAYETLREVNAQLGVQGHVLMLNAFAKSGRFEKAKGLYQQLKSEGYILQVQVYNVLLGMFSKAGCVEDAECIVKDMKDAGFEPNTFCYNAMLNVYAKVRNFRKAAQVFQAMQVCGHPPDTVTYNTLIHLYSRCLHTQEAYALLQQMKEAGCVPDLASHTMLLSAYGKLLMWDAAQALFNDMQNGGIQPDEATYHLMLDIYRKAGKPELTQGIVSQMKERGFEPTISTMQMLMDSYGKGGQTEGAEAVFNKMIEDGVDITVAQYTTLIDAYLRDGEYETAVSKLKKMDSEGIAANYVTWTCLIGAASKCETRDDAMLLLQALSDIGFPVPLELLTSNDSSVLLELECLLDALVDERPGAASGVLNVLQDLLWAFHKRVTAAHVFTLAMKKNIYERDFTRVQEEDWGADLCGLSPGAALVALTLWLINMQEASLQGTPRPSKSVLLVVGSSKRSNRISLSRTIKSHLWEMGAPFLLSKTREGTLIAKGYSVQLWLKDSPRCLDLDLENRATVPQLNSMQTYEGAWIRREMVPVFQQIEETMGDGLRPRKFCRLAEMHDEKRVDVMATDIKGRAEKLAKVRLRKAKAKVKFTLPVRTSLPKGT